MAEESTPERIKRLRKATDLTQGELAARIGVKKAAIQKYENGSIRDIPRVRVERMAAIFEVSPSYLLCFDDAKDPDPCALRYYRDEDIRAVAEFLTKNPDYKTLFSAVRNLQRGDVRLVKSIIDRFTEGGKL